MTRVTIDLKGYNARDAVRNLRDRGADAAGIRGLVADQIEAQLPEPKPEEPTGLGAVVVDQNGQGWVRTVGDGEARAWRKAGTVYDASPRVSYDEIDVRKVLQQGIYL